MALDAARKRQLDKGDLQGPGGQASGAHEFVYIHRRRTERREQPGPVLGRDLQRAIRSRAARNFGGGAPVRPPVRRGARLPASVPGRR